MIANKKQENIVFRIFRSVNQNEIDSQIPKNNNNNTKLYFNSNFFLLVLVY